MLTAAFASLFTSAILLFVWSPPSGHDTRGARGDSSALERAAVALREATKAMLDSRTRGPTGPSQGSAPSDVVEVSDRRDRVAGPGSGERPGSERRVEQPALTMTLKRLAKQLDAVAGRFEKLAAGEHRAKQVDDMIKSMAKIPRKEPRWSEVARLTREGSTKDLVFLTPRQVVERLGSPSTVETADNHLTWWYHGPSVSGAVTFRSGRVLSASFDQR